VAANALALIGHRLRTFRDDRFYMRYARSQFVERHDIRHRVVRARFEPLPDHDREPARIVEQLLILPKEPGPGSLTAGSSRPANPDIHHSESESGTSIIRQHRIRDTHHSAIAPERRMRHCNRRRARWIAYRASVPGGFERDGERAVVRQPMRPVFVACLQRLLDDETAEAAAVDEEDAADRCTPSSVRRSMNLSSPRSFTSRILPSVRITPRASAYSRSSSA
jgi:hypothetical protein